MDNYDPNMTLSGRMAKQTVQLTFQIWQYKATKEAVVGGNCMGFTVIDFAIAQVYESLPYQEIRYDGKDYYVAEITLEDDEGNILLCEDEENQRDDWLRDMLVSAEIVAIKPDNGGDDD